MGRGAGRWARRGRVSEWAAAVGYAGLRDRPTPGRPELTAPAENDRLRLPRPPRPPGLAREPLPAAGRRPRTKSLPAARRCLSPTPPRPKKVVGAPAPRGRRAARGGLTRAAPDPPRPRLATTATETTGRLRSASSRATCPSPPSSAGPGEPSSLLSLTDNPAPTAAAAASL